MVPNHQPVDYLRTPTIIGQETPRPTLEKCVSADRDSEIRGAPAVARHPVTAGHQEFTS